MASLCDLSALEARDRLVRGQIRAVELTQACLDRIAEREQAVQAWAYLDADLALRAAAAMDQHRGSGRPLGPLHGLPVGVKDIIDTADMPTENGARLDQGRRPDRDAAVVARLRAAGAVVLGKTVTTECAYLAPAKTRNPHDPARTPGGSSSGSAAAVASGMVPLAVGTQTGGSVIRPASYCGVVGFKPSHGLIPRSGILKLSRQLDTVGAFARTVEDAALLADALAGHDPADPDTSPAAPPRMLEIAQSDPPVKPAFAFVRTAAWGEVDADCARGLEELAEALGGQCDEIELPAQFAEGAAAHRRLMLADMAHNLRPYADRGYDVLADETRQAIDEGRAISAADYLAARDWREVLYAGLEEVFNRYDAVITPAVAGEAPEAARGTGSFAFNSLWTFLGVPALSLPVLESANGLPVGVQLIGRRGYDGRLMRTARWVVDLLAADG